MTLQLYNFPFSAMGSSCEIKLYCRDKISAGQVAEKVIKDVKRIEQRYSRYREDSILSEINKVADKGGKVVIDEETAALLNYADTCYRQSAGLFDITSGVLRKVWDFKSQTIPKQEEIKKILKTVGWKKVKVTSSSISFAISGMQLDFGGIGKEYAVDRAAGICWQQGIRHGLVNLGGDIKVIGPHPGEKPWNVGVRHPRKAGEMLSQIPVYLGAVASSGDYERCIVINGKRYGHILNPRTGWPVSGLVSVTVLSEQCVIAGSACTIAMLMEQQGKNWLKRLGLKYIWIDKNEKMGGEFE